MPQCAENPHFRGRRKTLWSGLVILGSNEILIKIQLFSCRNRRISYTVVIYIRARVIKELIWKLLTYKKYAAVSRRKSEIKVPSLIFFCSPFRQVCVCLCLSVCPSVRPSARPRVCVSFWCWETPQGSFRLLSEINSEFSPVSNFCFVSTQEKKADNLVERSVTFLCKVLCSLNTENRLLLRLRI